MFFYYGGVCESVFSNCVYGAKSVMDKLGLFKLAPNMLPFHFTWVTNCIIKCVTAFVYSSACLNINLDVTPLNLHFCLFQLVGLFNFCFVTCLESWINFQLPVHTGKNSRLQLVLF